MERRMCPEDNVGADSGVYMACAMVGDVEMHANGVWGSHDAPDADDSCAGGGRWLGGGEWWLHRSLG
ncbi:hypothetical protein U1Q18_022716, partial [Sarracenia purpurea var. burkii]